jgi:exonuclease III
MTTVIKVAIININEITTRTRVGILTEYMNCHDLDIVLLQEITSMGLLNMPGYDIYNEGTHMRGIVIVMRNITLTNILKLPTGRAIAAEYNGMNLFNICAPSGSARRTERE